MDIRALALKYMDAPANGAKVRSPRLIFFYGCSLISAPLTRIEQSRWTKGFEINTEAPIDSFLI
jgi:hypothetical protein